MGTRMWIITWWWWWLPITAYLASPPTWFWSMHMLLRVEMGFMMHAARVHSWIISPFLAICTRSVSTAE
jgi:hypothetical protein